jgi:hypothetical protein
MAEDPLDRVTVTAAQVRFHRDPSFGLKACLLQKSRRNGSASDNAEPTA